MSPESPTDFLEEPLALMGKKQIDEGKTKPADQVFNAIERKLKI